MFSLFFALFLLTQVETTTICDSGRFCTCNLDTNDQDFHGDIIDCAYSDSNVLNYQYTLPTSAYSLDLSSSDLTKIYPSSLFRSKNLKELYLSRNNITEIQPNSFELPELLKLDLSENLLEFIDENTFSAIKNLEYLNIGNNKFTTFSTLTFHHLNNLIEIVLDNNNIGPCLQETNIFNRDDFGLTHKIKTLSLSGINLNDVPNNFFVDAYDIRKLIISNNSIKDVFEIPFTLEYLDLSDNPIEEIANEDFADLKALKTLKLNNLQINVVPDYAFVDVHALMDLELERNKNLTSFSALAFGREVIDDSDDMILERLSLKGSRLITLDNRLKEPFGHLLELDLQGNPWNCDCKIKWFKSLQIKPDLVENLRCATPKRLADKRLFDTKLKLLTCTPDRHRIGIAVLILSFIIVAISVVSWIFLCVPKYQTRAKFLKKMNTPAVNYTVLPMSAPFV